MKAVPEELVRLAASCLTASQRISDAVGAAQAGLVVPSGAAGNSAAGNALLAAHDTAAEAAATALGRAASVLEQDMDDLYQCAFEFSETDEATARVMAGLTPTPGRRSGPVKAI